MIKIVSCNSDTVITISAKRADTFITRFIGLMFRKNFNEFDGLILEPCKGVHTFFMRFPIDVLFLDRSFRVIYAKENLKPWKLSAYKLDTCMVIELPKGTITSKDIKPGDILKIFSSAKPSK